MTMVKKLISTAFELAFTQHRETRETWINISHQIGGFLPDSELAISIKRIGDLDIVLRCMEEETKVDNSRRQEMGGDVDFSFHYQVMLSEVWICNSYEIFRLLKPRQLVNQNGVFNALVDDLTLLRIPIDKHEIANRPYIANDLKPLQMQRLSREGEVTGHYEYSRSDPLRAHITYHGKRGVGSRIGHVGGDRRCIRQLSLDREALLIGEDCLPSAI